jgi:hypothetical protein
MGAEGTDAQLLELKIKEVELRGKTVEYADTLNEKQKALL